MPIFRQNKDTLTLCDGLNRRVWRFKNGLLSSRSVFNNNPEGEGFRNDISYAYLTTNCEGNQSTLVFDGITERFITREPFMAPHRLGNILFVDVKRGQHIAWQFRLFPDTSGWESFIDISTQSLPLGDWRLNGREDRLDVIPVNMTKAVLHIGFYRSNTDTHNTFVKFSEHTHKGGAPLYLDGNLLRVEQPDGSGLIIVKMGPGPEERREKVTANFRVEQKAVVVLGWGLEPQDFQIGQTIRSHSVIVVPYQDGEPGAITALRTFWRQRWQHAFNGPRNVMVNPWGGRDFYRHISDAFLIREIKASQLLNATHYQIDDGWQTGKLADVCFSGLVSRGNHWKLNPEIFPKGFSCLVEAGEQSGIGLGIWFVPNTNQNYANWEEEADILAAFYRQYGITYFKIDNVMKRTREAELNLNRFLRRVHVKTNGKVYFNLDVTAGVGRSFLHAPEFGPLFPANRYPQSPLLSEKRYPANGYYPPNTLRNFWHLARYIPAHLIQVEIPNIWFNPADSGTPDKIAYKSRDITHHPVKYGPAYCAAIALFGSPLLWLEPSRTKPALLREYGRIMNVFHEHRDRIVEGNVYPVGQEPDGRSITGFASVRNDGGYVLIFRETGRSTVSRIQIPGTGTARLETLLSSTLVKAMLRNGCMNIMMPDPCSFALFRW